MNKIIYVLLFALIIVSCNSPKTSKVPVYIWKSYKESSTIESLTKEFKELKSHGVVGVCVNTGFDVEKATISAKAAKVVGLEYHAWIPCMLQEGLDSTWYAVNRLGESAFNEQAYVPYYKCLDPNNPKVQEYLIKKYSDIADIPEVDYIQLDYIRYVDVILAKGLWEKYGLIMNEEYPKADYCYCDNCVADFKDKYGIDIKAVKNPSKSKEWLQFRCDVITNFVNKLTKVIHAKNKKVSADVFPGPYSHAVKMVRQEWNKWNIDAFFPMNYNDFYLEKSDWVGKITKEEKNALKNNKALLYSGLFICKDFKNKINIKDPEGHGLIPSELDAVVKDVMEAGANGICLFSYDSMTPEHWKVLDKAIEKYAKK